MYAAGFLIEPEQDDAEDNDIMAMLEGHDGLSAKRLAEDRGLQTWLTKTVPHIAESLGIQHDKQSPPPTNGEDWKHIQVTAFMKRYMFRLFRIEFLKSKQSKTKQAANNKRARVYAEPCKIHKYGDHKRCRQSVPVRKTLDSQLELARAFITAKDSDEAWHQNAKIMILKTCEKLNISQNLLAYLKPRDDDFLTDTGGETNDLAEFETVTDQQNEKSVKFAKKKAEKVFKGIREERQRITDKYIGKNPYLLKANTFVELLLSAPYKIRTQQEITKFRQQVSEIDNTIL
jgi:hypothetical protein